MTDPIKEGTTQPLRTATYLLRFTPEEKAQLERKVRVAAAEGNVPLSLATALRMGAMAYLDDLIEHFRAQNENLPDGDDGLTTA
jgi:uncharacterized protein YqfA (UPF0365 family)